MHTTEGLVSKPCAGSVETVWNRLLETLKTLNVPLFATVDHAANARAAGLFMPETRVAFFGKPAVGTHLMLERPEVASAHRDFRSSRRRDDAFHARHPVACPSLRH